MEASFSSNKPYMFRAVYEWILDNDATPYLLVDTTQASVCVPEQHIESGQIVLNVEPNAIQSWFSDNDAISFSARFNGKAMNVFIPMSALLAIYAQENGLGMAFPPEEIIQESEKNNEHEAVKLQGINSQDDNSQDHKRLVPEGNDISDEDVQDGNLSEVVSIKTKKPPHLKVIK